MANSDKDVCFKCGKHICRNGCHFLDHLYHVDCFNCAVCDIQLTAGSFFPMNGKPYCEKHYLEAVDKCEKCHKPIKEKILKVRDKTYHPYCYVCTSCQGVLEGVPSTLDANGQAYCVDCYHDKFAPRCAACHKAIIPDKSTHESSRVVAMDKSFHIECYKCEDCSMKLSSKIEGHECYPLDGHLLCKTCNEKRLQKNQ